MDGARDVALVPLVPVAHVDEDGRLRLAELRGGRRVDLVDLALDLLQELAVAGHCFRKYSYAARGVLQGPGATLGACLSAAPASWSAWQRPPPRRSSSASPCSRAGTSRPRRRRRTPRSRRRRSSWACSCEATTRPMPCARPRGSSTRATAPAGRGPLRGAPRRESRVRGGRRRRRDRRLARRHGGAARRARRRATRRAASSGSTSASRSWRAATTRARARNGAQAERAEPDSPAALRAEDLLNPQFAPGRPPFVAPLAGAARARGPLARRSSLPSSSTGPRPAGSTSASPTASPSSASAGRSRRARLSRARWRPTRTACRRRWRRRSGASTRRIRRRRSPASGRSPTPTRSGVVRYHLGLGLSWIGQVEEAIRQLELAREADPDGFYGREAERLLDRLEDVR